MEKHEKKLILDLNIVKINVCKNVYFLVDVPSYPLTSKMVVKVAAASV